MKWRFFLSGCGLFAIVLFSGVMPVPKGTEGAQRLLDQLKPNQALTINEDNRGVEITILEDFPASHRVSEVGSDYFTAVDITEITEITIPVYQIRRIRRFKAP
jgi:hypothetical protein